LPVYWLYGATQFSSCVSQLFSFLFSFEGEWLHDVCTVRTVTEESRMFGCWQRICPDLPWEDSIW
jgi:hypothetical protein